jgi:agmatinase
MADYSRSRFVVVPVGYEETATYLKGTRRGPAAVLRASEQVETYDPVLRRETVEDGIHCLRPIYPRISPERLAGQLEKVTANILRDGKTPALIGGEHSISLGPIRAVREKYPHLGVLHLDAHGDLRDEYEGTAYGHGCIMRRVLEICPVTQVGVRSLSREEADLIEENPRIRTYFAHQGHPRGLLSHLPRVVYLSIDMDVFDPSLVPGVGTPEPGGLRWEEVVDLVAAVTRRRPVVAFDVVETRPIPGSVVSEFVAARLIYRIMGHIAVGKGIARKGRRR